MKNIKYYMLFLLLIQFSCHTNKIISYSKNLKLNNKKDTIYIYFKHSKKEIVIKKYLNMWDETYFFNFYNNNLFYKFPYYPEKYFYFFTYSTKNKKDGKLINNTLIEKNKRFLKKIKEKIITIKDFKNLNKKDIARFYSYNRYKTVYLIDKRESKNNKVYLRRVTFLGNFPRVQ